MHPEAMVTEAGAMGWSQVLWAGATESMVLEPEAMVYEPESMVPLRF